MVCKSKTTGNDTTEYSKGQSSKAAASEEAIRTLRYLSL
jgi:hypothetical protein